MHPPLNHLRVLRTILLSSVSFALCGAIFAQGNSPQTPVAANSGPKKPDDAGVAAAAAAAAIIPPPELAKQAADRLTTLSTVLDDAKALVVGGDVAGATRKIASTNVTKANTSEWHLETSQRLVQLAARFSHEGNLLDSKSAVTESLQQLGQAVTLAKASRDALGESRAHLVAGELHERYRGNTGAALVSYEAAVRANPEDPRAKEALERLQKSYANLQARGKKAAK
jgi:hypothetical protein